ncbi:hypothetical protein [Streptomyces griseus]|uniref:hypothetical protein n=1 Tax=Streptomyces griseus TaxID=1911 RepID=UPI0004C4FE06|nr:hypothetical protein [Streptomyces griseus]
MFIRITADGEVDGDALSESIASLLGVFNSVPQFVANDDWQIEIMENDEEGTEEDDDLPQGWFVDCSPSAEVSWGSVSTIAEGVAKLLVEHGGANPKAQLVEDEG